jgi:hypothetical protein
MSTRDWILAVNLGSVSELLSFAERANGLDTPIFVKARHFPSRPTAKGPPSLKVHAGALYYRMIRAAPLGGDIQRSVD